MAKKLNGIILLERWISLCPTHYCQKVWISGRIQGCLCIWRHVFTWFQEMKIFIAFRRKKSLKIQQNLTELEGKKRMFSLYFKGHRRPWVFSSSMQIQWNFELAQTCQVIKSCWNLPELVERCQILQKLVGHCQIVLKLVPPDSNLQVYYRSPLYWVPYVTGSSIVVWYTLEG